MNRLGDFLNKADEQTVEVDLVKARINELRNNLGRAYKGIVKMRAKLNRHKTIRFKDKTEFFRKLAVIQQRLQQKEQTIARILKKLHAVDPALKNPVKL